MRYSPRRSLESLQVRRFTRKFDLSTCYAVLRSKIAKHNDDLLVFSDCSCTIEDTDINYSMVFRMSIIANISFQ